MASFFADFVFRREQQAHRTSLAPDVFAEIFPLVRRSARPSRSITMPWRATYNRSQREATIRKTKWPGVFTNAQGRFMQLKGESTRGLLGAVALGLVAACGGGGGGSGNAPLATQSSPAPF